jgi:hypothetical protein
MRRGISPASTPLALSPYPLRRTLVPPRSPRDRRVPDGGGVDAQRGGDCEGGGVDDRRVRGPGHVRHGHGALYVLPVVVQQRRDRERRAAGGLRPLRRVGLQGRDDGGLSSGEERWVGWSGRRPNSGHHSLRSQRARDSRTITLHVSRAVMDKAREEPNTPRPCPSRPQGVPEWRRPPFHASPSRPPTRATHHSRRRLIPRWRIITPLAPLVLSHTTARPKSPPGWSWHIVSVSRLIWTLASHTASREYIASTVVGSDGKRSFACPGSVSTLKSRKM